MYPAAIPGDSSDDDDSATEHSYLNNNNGGSRGTLSTNRGRGGFSNASRSSSSARPKQDFNPFLDDDDDDDDDSDDDHYNNGRRQGAYRSVPQNNAQGGGGGGGGGGAPRQQQARSIRDLVSGNSNRPFPIANHPDDDDDDDDDDESTESSEEDSDDGSYTDSDDDEQQQQQQRPPPPPPPHRGAPPQNAFRANNQPESESESESGSEEESGSESESESDESSEEEEEYIPPSVAAAAAAAARGNPFDNVDDEGLEEEDHPPPLTTASQGTTSLRSMDDFTFDSRKDDLAPSSSVLSVDTEEEEDLKPAARKDPPLHHHSSDSDDDDDDYDDGNNNNNKEYLSGDTSLSDLLAESMAAKQNNPRGSAAAAAGGGGGENQEPQGSDMSISELLTQSMTARRTAATTSSSASDINQSKTISFRDESLYDDDDDRKPQALPQALPQTLSSSHYNDDIDDDEESQSFFSPKNQVKKSKSKFSGKSVASSMAAIVEDLDDEYELNDDIYSILFLASVGSMAFAFSMLTFLLKMSIYSLIMADLIGAGSADNPLSAPKGISTLVRCAQFFMLPVAVAIQDDLVASIALLNVKYRPNEEIRRLPGASFGKFVFGSACRFIDGLYSLVVNFVLLETSSSVLGLMLNFAALGFLTEIDNVAFHLALEGYLSDGIEFIAKAAEKCTLPKKTFSKSHAKSYLDSFFFVIVYFAILAGWLVITFHQMNGHYLCQSFQVNFGELGWGASTINVYTGVYEKISHRIDDRAVYVGRDGSKQGVFAYCNWNSKWTFIETVEDPNSLGTSDVCVDYLLQSGPADDIYDPTDTSSTEWVFHSEDGFSFSVPATFEIICQ